MIEPDGLLEYFASHGISFFTGVPDSQLQSFCIALYNRYGSGNANHIVAANEGNAVALGAGYHLATGGIPLVYLQNSGLGNAVNPIASLTDPAVYNIPVVYLVGWRGEPGLHDEPQHAKQGAITCGLLDLLGIPHIVVDRNSSVQTVSEIFAGQFAKELSAGRSVAIVVKKGAFEKPLGTFPFRSAELGREQAIRRIADATGAEDFIVSTTGRISRELFEYRKTSGSPLKGHDFFTVGSMGHASSIALSIALRHPEKTVWCLDGDGAILMHMGNLAVIGSMKPGNLIHVVLNNASHESVGGMPTVVDSIDLGKIAAACGYAATERISTEAELLRFLTAIRNGMPLPVFAEIVVSPGSRPDLIRPDTTPEENKELFMRALRGDL